MKAITYCEIYEIGENALVVTANENGREIKG